MLDSEMQRSRNRDPRGEVTHDVAQCISRAGDTVTEIWIRNPFWGRLRPACARHER
jgi:hypothetical protein